MATATSPIVNASRRVGAPQHLGLEMVHEIEEPEYAIPKLQDLAASIALRLTRGEDVVDGTLMYLMNYLSLNSAFNAHIAALAKDLASRLTMIGRSRFPLPQLGKTRNTTEGTSFAFLSLKHFWLASIMSEALTARKNSL